MSGAIFSENGIKNLFFSKIQPTASDGGRLFFGVFWRFYQL